MDETRIAGAKRWIAERAEAWGALERYYQPEWVALRYINELEAKVSLTESRIAALEAENADLRGQIEALIQKQDASIQGQG